MSDDKSFGISLPDRLAHDIVLRQRMDSPKSAPSFLEITTHHENVVLAKDYALRSQRSVGATEMSLNYQHPECVSTCKSFESQEETPLSPISALTADPSRDMSRGSSFVEHSLMKACGLDEPDVKHASMPSSLCHVMFNSAVVDHDIRPEDHLNGKVMEALQVKPIPGTCEQVSKLSDSSASLDPRCHERMTLKKVYEVRKALAIPNWKSLDPIVLLGQGQSYGGHIDISPSDESDIEPSPDLCIAKRTEESRKERQNGMHGIPDGDESSHVRLAEREISMFSRDQTLRLPDQGIWWKNEVGAKENSMGILLAIERIMDCFERPVVSRKSLRLSQEKNDEETVDSSEEDFEWEPGTERDGVDWLFPCCSDVTTDPDTNDFLDESTLEDLSYQYLLYSKESLLTSDGSETLSSIDKLFGLEFEEVPMKDGIVNQTATIDGDSNPLNVDHISN